MSSLHEQAASKAVEKTKSDPEVGGPVVYLRDTREPALLALRMSGIRGRFGYWSLLWDGFRATILAVATVLSIVLVFMVPGDEKVSARLAVGLTCVAAFLIAAHVEALRRCSRLISFGSARIIAVKAPFAPYGDAECICVLESATSWQIGGVVSFYWLHEEMERELCVGMVRRVQDDGRLLVTLHRPSVDDDAKAFLGELRKGTHDAVKRLRVSALVTAAPESKAEAMGAGPPPPPQGAVAGAPPPAQLPPATQAAKQDPGTAS